MHKFDGLACSARREPTLSTRPGHRRRARSRNRGACGFTLLVWGAVPREHEKICSLHLQSRLPRATARSRPSRGLQPRRPHVGVLRPLGRFTCDRYGPPVGFRAPTTYGPWSNPWVGLRPLVGPRLGYGLRSAHSCDLRPLVGSPPCCCRLLLPRRYLRLLRPYGRLSHHSEGYGPWSALRRATAFGRPIRGFWVPDHTI